MTFEYVYGRWLVGEINKRTFSRYGLMCKQYNELAFKPLAKNPDEIAVIINGGGATRSSVIGQDQNSGTFSVMVLCKKENTVKVQEAISFVQEQYNALPIEMPVVQTISAETEEYGVINVKSVFFTPIVIDAQDFPTKQHGTLKVTFMQFTVTVLYGATAVVAPDKYVLSIDETDYEIEHVASYDNASIPLYDSYLAQGEDRNKQVFVARNNSWAITIFKTSKENALQTILENEAYAKDNGLLGRSIILKKDLTLNEETQEIDYEVKIPIQTYQLAESYVDNAAAYVLTLMA